MVVQDEDVHPQGAGVLHLGQGAGAAIGCQQQVGPLGPQPVDGARVEAVPLLEAVRDVGEDAASQGLKPLGEEGGRRHAVHVEVGEDGHQLAPLQSEAEPLDGARHVGQRKWVWGCRRAI